MLTGHTKFAPDSMFGLFKRKYRNSKVDCLADIENVVCKASPSGMLIPQLCGGQCHCSHVWLGHLPVTVFKEAPLHQATPSH